MKKRPHFISEHIDLSWDTPVGFAYDYFSENPFEDLLFFRDAKILLTVSSNPHERESMETRWESSVTLTISSIFSADGEDASVRAGVNSLGQLHIRAERIQSEEVRNAIHKELVKPFLKRATELGY